MAAEKLYLGRILDVILSYAFPDEIAAEVCSTPGSAITFLWGYAYLPTVMPSQFAEAAYKFAATEECKRVNKLNEWGIPAIFIKPD